MFQSRIKKAFSSESLPRTRSGGLPRTRSGVATGSREENPSKIRRLVITGTLLATTAITSGCSSIDRLSQIGETPKLNAIENPTAQPGYKPVQMPMPKPEVASYNANSLWRNGSRAFFKDQRAHQIGDLLTITVNITDKANLANETQRSRTSKEDAGVSDFVGSKLLT